MTTTPRHCGLGACFLPHGGDSAVDIGALPCQNGVQPLCSFVLLNPSPDLPCACPRQYRERCFGSATRSLRVILPPCYTQGGDSSILGTVSTQTVGVSNNVGESRSRHQDEASKALSTSRPNGSGAVTNTSSGRASGKLANRIVRVGAKRSAASKECPPDISGAPRGTADSLDGRPNLDSIDDEGAVDPDALKAALLAVQADATVSREGLHRMLRAVQRRPLLEDSEPVSREGKVKVKVAHSAAVSARSSGEASPIHGERDRRCMTMNDGLVSNQQLIYIYI